MGHSMYDPGQDHRPAWNAGHKLEAKRPLKPKQVWAIRFWLERERRLRDRGCDLVKVRIGDLVNGSRVRARAMVIQQKAGRPVQFELLEPARTSILDWLERRGGALDDFAFPSRTEHIRHISTRQYARLRLADEGLLVLGSAHKQTFRSRPNRDIVQRSAPISKWVTG